MNKYGKAAVETVRLMQKQSFTNPREAWGAATYQIFGRGTSSQKKGCPRNAFLGLCEEGIVMGIQPGCYTKSTMNKLYAIEAVQALRKHPELVNDPTTLWKIASRKNPKNPDHNQQMHVVVALWMNGLIE